MYTPPFIVTDEILHLVSEISELIGTLNALLGERELPKDLAWWSEYSRQDLC